MIPHHRIEVHRACQCAACGENLPPDAPFLAKTGYSVIDLKENDDQQWGIELECALHHFGETGCGCGHQTLIMPGHGDCHESADGTVTTRLSEWRLIGPRLASFIVFLTYRMRLSSARVQELLREWLGLQVATGTIDNCLREVAMAFWPVYLLLLNAIPREPLVHADETPWREKGRFRKYCELVDENAEHEKTVDLAGEFLNDWDAIWKVVEYPELPATNNVAERILRHWVIARQVSHGTRTPEGSRAVAILASIIETCRLRGVKTWDYLVQVIAKRRRGDDPSPIPLPATA